MTCIFPTSLWLARLATLCLALALIPSDTTAKDLLKWRDAPTIGSLVHELETWLDHRTNLPAHPDRPAIRWIDSAAAQTLNGQAHKSDGSRIRGLYDEITQTIWLVRPWDRRNPFDVSVLLHELVHHRQTRSGHWYCPGAQELPAYRAQQAWLAELGLEPRVNWIAVVLESGCTPRDIHPD